jgi:hypothetical protein
MLLLLFLLAALTSGLNFDRASAIKKQPFLKHLKTVASSKTVHASRPLIQARASKPALLKGKPATFTHVKKIPVKHPHILIDQMRSAVAARHLKQASVVKHPKHAAEKRGKIGPEHLKRGESFPHHRASHASQSNAKHVNSLQNGREARLFGKYKYF